MQIVSIFMILTLFNQAIATGIPIWELLTHEEKIENLTLVFLRLVHLYCKKSNIPDCEKVLTLYGVSNLLKVDDRTLDFLDPNHRDARSALWSRVMSGSFTMPHQEQDPRNLRRESQPEWERDFNLISNIENDYYYPSQDYDVGFGERFPHAVKVPAPPHFLAPPHFQPPPNLQHALNEDVDLRKPKRDGIYTTKTASKTATKGNKLQQRIDKEERTQQQQTPQQPTTHSHQQKHLPHLLGSEEQHQSQTQHQQTSEQTTTHSQPQQTQQNQLILSHSLSDKVEFQNSRIISIIPHIPEGRKSKSANFRNLQKKPGTKQSDIF